MALTFKIKRGTVADHATYVGPAGELTMVQADSTNPAELRLHDGTTPGGIAFGRSDLSNVSIPVGGVNFEYKYDTQRIPANSELNIQTGYIALSEDINPNAPDLKGTLYVAEIDKNGTNLIQFLQTCFYTLA